MKKNILLPLLLVVVFSCNNINPTNEIINNEKYQEYNLSYANGFSITDLDSCFTEIVIFNPWQTADNIKLKYVVGNKKKSDSKHFVNIISPIKKVVCLSTTHIAFIDQLNEISSVVGVSSPQFVHNKTIAQKHKNHEVVDIGFDQNLNYEAIYALKPDVIFAYGIGNEITQFYQRFNEIGIPVVVIGEYLENDPLAKLEWIKLFGLLYNKYDISKQYFDSVTNVFNSISNKTMQLSYQPTVFCNIPWKGIWYAPGGNSFMAKLINYAGGKYIWEKSESNSSLALSFETVFVKASKADVWINPGVALRLNDLISEDERLSDFSAFKNSKVYNNNLRTNEMGGNDFWESGVTKPHIILQDLIAIIHPELATNHKLYYYRHLK